MILQLVIADSLLRYKRKRRTAFNGVSNRKRTPVRVVFGDPKRNCEGYGLCKVDLGEDDLPTTAFCSGAKVEYGIILSEADGETFYLVISKGNYNRYVQQKPGSAFAPQQLKVSIELAREIGLRGVRMLLAPPQELAHS
ncbi:hypothetical protein CEQ90_12040 [Lewinellaceae bacterium SD302]|nr:hypothetical protein CEQ90_12040 [Lewinellaceae bacterium SD302]